MAGRPFPEPKSGTCSKSAETGRYTASIPGFSPDFFQTNHHFSKSRTHLIPPLVRVWRIRVPREAFGMAAIGSLVFCTDCGNLLDANTGRKAYIQCDLCGTQNEGMAAEYLEGIQITCLLVLNQILLPK